MRILVLDTIHGGAELAAALRGAGHEVDEVDVYRGRAGTPIEEALVRTYDLVTAPVHLDPDHPLLAEHGPAISHHEMVQRVLGERLPHPFIEITGARGKTTTAHALASLLPGPGILHTSTGTYRYPERELLWKKSITPASLIPAVREAERVGGWLVAEESLGVSGAGDVAVLTSPDDYPVAAGKKSAIAEKCRLVGRAAKAVLSPGIELPGGVRADSIVTFEGGRCRYAGFGVAGTFKNPLCTLAGYRTPLALAAATACVLGIDPSPLAAFAALPGRMAARREGDLLILDNANSGTNMATTVEAARYARELSGGCPLTLVIGEEAHAVCEGFSAENIRRTVAAVNPAATVYVGEGHEAPTLEAGLALARKMTPAGAVVLAVKTWR
ncbi:coenzyme F430 synthase [Methanoculleus sp. Wushi-C6]|uniref:Coenzyme F430 synthase n=1 Tax=Methanoculleus caldifontis TaxID=2651577 RepID=A0ABU3X418_9EURY|nr:coenzyme F430 synthase [Methanoculleus sp. Wushi-C6]MDV2482805.1 coenzyme F430 synthase [Methanoculleus sp. Wushi-C6]